MITPIRIVPLQDSPIAIAATTGPAQLTYRGGPLLTSAQVFTIFWGSAWQQSPQSDLISRLNQFFPFVLSSSLIDLLAEYDVPGKSISHGSFTGTITITDNDPAGTVSDATIQQALQGWISAGTAPPTTANTLYFVYTPPGVTVTLNSDQSCAQFCGYHNDINSTIFYAVEPYPSCAGCTSGLADLDALTVTSSHELCEAITDPVPGSGWYDDANGEIGDICAWQVQHLGSYQVQAEWSNAASACLIAPAGGGSGSSSAPVSSSPPMTEE